MALRIDEAVCRGEIDNTVEGHTTGRIWLAGRDEPLVLDLLGDCWRDLAGARLRFENPLPVGGSHLGELAASQQGLVGDMTASRKHKLPSVGDDELQRLHAEDQEIPYEWKNMLYLEWFSEANGRVMIESANYQLQISPHVWEMDEDAEEAQKLANLHAMRDCMAAIIRRREPRADDKFPDELDEYEWEERLKESDRLTDAYQEVLEKYMDDPDSERKEAFVMGWDGLLDALADRDEAGDDDDDYADEADGYEAGAASSFTDDDEDPDDEGFPAGDSSFMDDEDDHPLQAQAQELALRAMDVVRGDSGPGTPAYQLVTCLLQVSGKLAGALNGRGSGYEPETGYVLAVLKRCLNWLNEAVGACQELMASEQDPDQLAALQHLRGSAFEIRDGITELRRQLK